MAMQGQTDFVGVGGTGSDGGNLAALLLALEEMGKKWPDDTGFQLGRAIEALGAIIDTLAPLLEVALVRSADGNCVKDIPAIEQLRALHDALLDLSETGRRHPQFAAIEKKNPRWLRRDEKQLQSALIEMVKIIYTLQAFKFKKQAELFVVRKMRLKYREADLGQKQLADMARAVAKRTKK